MSVRGDRGTVDEQIADLSERVRHARYCEGEGPASFGPMALVSRGAAGYVFTSDTFTGTPSGDPFHLVTSVEVELEADRLYMAFGVVEVNPVGAGTFDYAVEIGRDINAAGESTGDGVAAHSVVARWEDRFVATAHLRVAVPFAPFLSIEDEVVTFALLTEDGLEMAGGIESSLVILDASHTI